MKYPFAIDDVVLFFMLRFANVKRMVQQTLSIVVIVVDGGAFCISLSLSLSLVLLFVLHTFAAEYIEMSHYVRIRRKMRYFVLRVHFHAIGYRLRFKWLCVYHFNWNSLCCWKCTVAHRNISVYKFQLFASMAGFQIDCIYSRVKIESNCDRESKTWR